MHRWREKPSEDVFGSLHLHALPADFQLDIFSLRLRRTDMETATIGPLAKPVGPGMTKPSRLGTFRLPSTTGTMAGGQVLRSAQEHCPSKLECLGVWFCGNSFILDTETEYEWVPVVMAEDFQHKNVALVAGIIGAVILLLGLGGVVLQLV